jgi:hypothetical protein
MSAFEAILLTIVTASTPLAGDALVSYRVRVVGRGVPA